MQVTADVEFAAAAELLLRRTARSAAFRQLVSIGMVSVPEKGKGRPRAIAPAAPVPPLYLLFCPLPVVSLNTT